jgi:hypothetical protein
VRSKKGVDDTVMTFHCDDIGLLDYVARNLKTLLKSARQDANTPP